MHFEHAADYERASRYLEHVAVNAMHRSAYREAIAASRRGLDLVASLPDSDERARRELRLRLALGAPLIATEGYATPEVGSVYREARRLCERLGTTSEVSQVFWGLWTFHVVKAELSTAREIAGEFLRLAEHVAHPGVAMRGHWAMGITSTHQGNFRLALEHFDKALSLYDPGQDRDDIFVDALNPGVAVRCFAGWCLWFVGQPDRGLVRIEEAVALARELSEPHGLAHALVFAAVFHQLRREKPMAQQHAEAAMALADEHGLVFYGAMAQMVHGWVLIGHGNDEHAVEQMRQGMAGWQRTGAQLMRPHFLALLAEAFPPTDRQDQGLSVLDEALALAESTGERMYEAEIHRLRGERLLRGAPECVDVEAAEACFGRSLAVARQQDALSLELRTAMSEARPRGEGASPLPAHRAVLSIYERFEEGFDTADLRDARGLLDLSAER
jgi:adenylate cyclase